MLAGVAIVALLIMILAYVMSRSTDDTGCDVPALPTHAAPRFRASMDGATERAMERALAVLDKPEPLRVDGDGSFGQPIVGESYYLDTFENLFGPRKARGVKRAMPAELVCEADNEHDPLAVSVRLDGGIVGHLSREDARLFRAKYDGRDVECDAQIRGGWDSGDGDEGDYGVMLDLALE